MSKYKNYIIIIFLLANISGCKDLKNSIQKFDHSLKGQNYNEEMRKKEKTQSEFVAKAKGYNFHNLDIRGLKTGVSRQTIEKFMRDNTSSSDEVIRSETFNSGTLGMERYAFYKAGESSEETVIAGITGADKSETAYFITRMKAYAYKTGPEIDVLANTLFEKYGPPSAISTRQQRSVKHRGGEYISSFGKESQVKVAYRYYWFFDKDGNLKPRQILSWNETRDYLNDLEHVEPPEARIKSVFKKYNVSKCRDNCGFGISALVADEYYKDLKARIVKSYNITISDLSILKKSMDQAELIIKSQEIERVRNSREKNKQVDL
jgi:hypothetical protein